MHEAGEGVKDGGGAHCAISWFTRYLLPITVTAGVHQGQVSVVCWDGTLTCLAHLVAQRVRVTLPCATRHVSRITLVDRHGHRHAIRQAAAGQFAQRPLLNV